MTSIDSYPSHNYCFKLPVIIIISEVYNLITPLIIIAVINIIF